MNPSHSPARYSIRKRSAGKRGGNSLIPTRAPGRLASIAAHRCVRARVEPASDQAHSIAAVFTRPRRSSAPTFCCNRCAVLCLGIRVENAPQECWFSLPKASRKRSQPDWVSGIGFFFCQPPQETCRSPRRGLTERSRLAHVKRRRVRHRCIGRGAGCCAEAKSRKVKERWTPARQSFEDNGAPLSVIVPQQRPAKPRANPTGTEAVVIAGRLFW